MKLKIFDLKKSVSGGALPMVVGISLVIISITSLLLLAGYYFKIQDIRIQKREIIHRNLVSGINLILEIKNEMNYNEEIILDLFGNQTDSIRLLKKNWGCFEVGTVNSFSGNYTDSIAIMMGVKHEGIYKSALYLVDNRRPLSIAGDTKIIGDVYLPATGVRPSHIGRVGFKGHKLVQGNIFKSKSTMPPLNFDQILRIQQLFEMPAKQNQTELESISDSLFHSFLSRETLVFDYHDSLIVDQNLNGNILMRSGKVIVIKNSATVRNVIFMAPVILIEDGFEGSGQFICNESILIGKNSKLNYPSCIVVLDNEMPSLIEIEKNVLFDGYIFQFSNGHSPEHKKLRLKENSVFTGIAHIDGLVDLKGAIMGHLSCQKFLIDLESGTYENYLYNALIENNLDKMFIAPILYKERKSAIICYLK